MHEEIIIMLYFLFALRNFFMLNDSSSMTLTLIEFRSHFPFDCLTNSTRAMVYIIVGRIPVLELFPHAHSKGRRTRM